MEEKDHTSKSNSQPGSDSTTTKARGVPEDRPHDKGGKKILIVDDEESLRRALVDRFKQEKDFEVYEAAGGEAALGIASIYQPDVVILDVLMPEIDGIEVLKKLRAEGWGKDTPVILLTNVDDEARIVDILMSGATDYLLKSDWDIEDIVERVRQKVFYRVQWGETG